MKLPTCVSVVHATLLAMDDFATPSMIRDASCLGTNQVSASLHELRKYKAAECLSEGGKLWWYLTPDSDQRQKTVDMRQEELKPRKKRKQISKKEKQS